MLGIFEDTDIRKIQTLIIVVKGFSQKKQYLQKIISGAGARCPGWAGQIIIL